MSTLFALTKRNVKLFFKDKMLFFTSLITPVILLVLYVTFLAGVFEDVFRASLPEGTSDKLINAAVGGQLFSSLLAVCCVTVAFCSNMLMIADKTNGARGDIAISPVRRSTVALSYFIASAFSTLIICFAATAVCLVYIACIGWYMSFADIMLILLDVIVLTLFGTGLSSLINYFISVRERARSRAFLFARHIRHVAFPQSRACGRAFRNGKSRLPVRGDSEPARLAGL